jgi:hypothetical protein
MELGINLYTLHDLDEPLSSVLERCIDAARKVGVEWLIYEHDTPEDPLVSLEHGNETLRSVL